MIVYHTDTHCRLLEGQVLTLRHARTPIHYLYPEGVSSFGERVFLKPENEIQAKMQAIEIMFDYVRRLCFPDKPSRFQSVFASASPEDSKAWHKRISQGSAIDTDGSCVCGNTSCSSIYAVQSDRIYIADAQFLDCQSALPAGQPSLSNMLPFALAYWESVQELKDLRQLLDGHIYLKCELLLVPPVRVLHRVAP